MIQDNMIDKRGKLVLLPSSPKPRVHIINSFREKIKSNFISKFISKKKIEDDDNGRN